jgi:UDP-N-acetyl-D-mannosaminuronic acid dehydrogenase
VSVPELENGAMTLDDAAAKGSAAPGSASRPAVRASLNQVDITIVGGAGHVGIPLVLCFAETGLHVQINDRNEATVRSLMNGELPFIEYDAQPLLDSALARGFLTPASRPSEIGRKGPVIVTIGTPVDEFLNPVQGPVKKCIDELLPHIDDGQLIILRSTVYPGTTDWLSKYLARQGRRLGVAFCPERVVQGYGIRELKSLPQVVSGTTPEAEEEAATLFGRIAPEVIRVKPLEAEFSKIFANVYRYLEFATTNQFYMIAQSAGADYHEILRAMTQSYPRAARMPGPGFAAGPCLFKDTMQLAAYSRNQFALGHAAMLVNEGLVLYVIEHLRQTYDLGNCTVGLLGMAFKPEVDDTRSSLSYKLKKGLQLHAAGVLTTDPFVKSDPTLIPVEDVIERSDVLVLCTPHKVYESLDTKDKPIFDVWHPAKRRTLDAG